MVKPVDKIYKEFDFSTSRKQTMNNLMFVNDNEINTPKFELDRAQVPFFVSHARKGRQQKVRKYELTCETEIFVYFVDLVTNAQKINEKLVI